MMSYKVLFAASVLVIPACSGRKNRRFMFASSTVSKSYSCRRPTPQRASISAATDPTPPTPTTATALSRIFLYSCTMPMRCRAMRREYGLLPTTSEDISSALILAREDAGALTEASRRSFSRMASMAVLSVAASAPASTMAASASRPSLTPIFHHSLADVRVARDRGAVPRALPRGLMHNAPDLIRS